MPVPSRRRDHGQVTAEYAVGTLGAVTIAAAIVGPISPVMKFIVYWTRECVEHAYTLNLPDLFRWPW